MTNKEKNSIGAVLTKESLENIYMILEGIDFSLRDPGVKDSLWVHDWEHFIEVNQYIASILAMAEDQSGNGVTLDQAKHPSKWKKNTWTEKEALDAFMKGSDDNNARYLLALYWLNNYAHPDIQTRMDNAYKVAHQEGIELPEAYKIAGTEKLEQATNSNFLNNDEIEKAIDEALSI